jgi:hypothetical protein
MCPNHKLFEGNKMKASTEMLKKVTVHGVEESAGSNVTDTFSPDYTVSVNGTPCTVYAVRVSAVPFNVWWKGHQRPIDQSELASTVSFEADEPVTLEIACVRDFSRAVVRPLSKGIATEIACKTITLRLEKLGQYVVEPHGEHRALHIFFNRTNRFPEKEKATYNFGAGIHFPGVIRLQDNDCVYIDKDAVVYGSLFGHGVKNVHIFGYGILDGSYEERLTPHCYSDATKGNVKFYESSNIRIEGVTFRNSAVWCINLFGCHHVDIDNIKVVGQWRYNTDGIDIVNSQNVTVRNSFVRSFDDTIVLKGIDVYEHIDVKHIRVENCVLWCGWGGTLEIGFETACREYSDIVFEDCDLIRNSSVAIRVHQGDYAHIHNVAYRNIRIEWQNDTLPEIVQQSDAQTYDSKGSAGMPWLIVITNSRFRQAWDIISGTEGFLPKEEYEKRRGSDGKIATIGNITFEDIGIFSESGTLKPIVFLDSTNVKNGIIENVTLKNIALNGRKLSNEDLDMQIIGAVKNLTIG